VETAEVAREVVEVAEVAMEEVGTAVVEWVEAERVVAAMVAAAAQAVVAKDLVERMAAVEVVEANVMVVAAVDMVAAQVVVERPQVTMAQAGMAAATGRMAAVPSKEARRVAVAMVVARGVAMTEAPRAAEQAAALAVRGVSARTRGCRIGRQSALSRC